MLVSIGPHEPTRSHRHRSGEFRHPTAVGFDRPKDHYRQLADLIALFDTVEPEALDLRRARDLQDRFAEDGKHRMLSLTDALVSVAAQRTGSTVLHYDVDFDHVERLLGVRAEWVVERGSVS